MGIIPISTPSATEQGWYSYMSGHSAYYSNKLESEYPSESIKGNFDRLLSRNVVGSGRVNAATRQYRNLYKMNVDGFEILISAEFFPYKNCSIVDYVVQGVSNPDSNTKFVDWTGVMKQIDARL